MMSQIINDFSVQTIIPRVVNIHNLFSNAELQNIIELSDKNLQKSNFSINHKYDNEVRNSLNSFCRINENTKWIFDRFNYIISEVNYNYYMFDLIGYDYYQYTEYRESGHYEWHMDTAIDENMPCRKLSLSLLLNDPEKDFEGGELCITTNLSEQKGIEMKKGEIAIFPSFLMHKVTPVTRGIRKSLVIWVIGPKFK